MSCFSKLLLVQVAFCLAGSVCLNAADDGVLTGWFTRSDQAKADQPHWITPVVTVTPRLEQGVRTDFVIQPFPDGNPTVNLGNGKGVELIPSERVELIVNVPPRLCGASATPTFSTRRSRAVPRSAS